MHRERWFSKRKVRDCECEHPDWTHGTNLICKAEGCGCLKFKRKRLANKYGAQREEVKGRSYHSKFEAKQGAELDYQVRAELIKEVRPQVKLRLEAEGVFITNYIVDFEVTHLDGSIEYVEAKGKETEAFQIKKRLMEIYLKHHPGTQYRIVKQRGSQSFVRSKLNNFYRA